MSKSNNLVSMTVASNIRSFAAKRRMGHAEIATKMSEEGVPMGVHTIRSIVGGRRDHVTVDEMAAFARVFGTDVDEMLSTY